MKIIASLILLVLLGLFLFTNDLNVFHKVKTFSVGKVLTTQGIVMAKLPNNPYFENLKPQEPISLPIKILTGFDSHLKFEIGSEIQLLEETQIEMNQLGNKIQINLLSGTLKRGEPLSENIEVYIDKVQQNQAIVVIPKNKTLKSSLPVLSTPSSQENERELSDFQTQLKNTFRLHQRFLERCFIKYYERKKGVTKNGKVLIRFSINPQGSIENVKIVESEMNDKKYHSCIKDVVSRVRIKYYDKKARIVDFPIQMTLPL